MTTNIEQIIIEKLKCLPPERQKEVLDFVETLEYAGSAEPHHVSNAKSIWDKIEARVAQVPPEVWDELPTDGSINVDHYLYGAPKK